MHARARRAAEEPWVGSLLYRDYDALYLDERLAALMWLVDTCCTSPTIRARLYAREVQLDRLKKQLAEDARQERARKTAEAAVRMQRAQEETQLRMQELQRRLLAGEAVTPEEVNAAKQSPAMHVEVRMVVVQRMQGS